MTAAELPAERATSASLPSSDSSGRHDHAARRRAKRSGREAGCWTYLPGDLLRASDLTQAQDGGPPFYRVWGGQRGRFVVTLYDRP